MIKLEVKSPTSVHVCQLCKKPKGPSKFGLRATIGPRATLWTPLIQETIV